MMGNPHSGWGGPAGYAAAAAEARAATLALCNASSADYECIFTSGATGKAAALREALVALAYVSLLLWRRYLHGR